MTHFIFLLRVLMNEHNSCFGVWVRLQWTGNRQGCVLRVKSNGHTAYVSTGCSVASVKRNTPNSHPMVTSCWRNLRTALLSWFGGAAADKCIISNVALVCANFRVDQSVRRKVNCYSQGVNRYTESTL
jgi:hypothetical protein